MKLETQKNQKETETQKHESNASSSMSRVSSRKKASLSSGFTIIEMMISLTIFIVVMTIGMAAVLNVNATHKKSQQMRALIDNLNFIMEDMARNIRLGNSYHCNGTPSILVPILSSSTTVADAIDCPVSSNNFQELALEAVNGISRNADNTPHPEDQIIYKIEDTGSGKFGIFKYNSAVNVQDFVQLTPDGIEIDPLVSGFNVAGADNAGSGLGLQPTVTIRLAGKMRYKNIETPFNIQTTVAQRGIDE